MIGTVYCIGNGDSRFSPGMPERYPGFTIGCNVAAFGVECNEVVALDLRVFVRHAVGFKRCHADCLLVSPVAKQEDAPEFVNVLPASRDHTWTDDDDQGILCHSNTGLTAIHLASLRKPDRIVLIGFDMKAPGKLTTDGGGLYPEGDRTNAQQTYETMMDAFRSHAHSLSRFNIVNASMDSALTMFPKVDLRSVM